MNNNIYIRATWQKSKYACNIEKITNEVEDLCINKTKKYHYLNMSLMKYIVFNMYAILFCSGMINCC